MNTTIKGQIASVTTAVPALILSQKIVSEVGLVKGILPKYYVPIMRRHPVLSAIFLVGLAAQTVYAAKLAREQRQQLEEQLVSSSHHFLSMLAEFNGNTYSTPEEFAALQAREEKMAKYEEHLRLAKELPTTQDTEQPLSRISPLWYQDRGCSDPEQQIKPKVSTHRVQVPVDIAELHTALLEQVRQAFDEVVERGGEDCAAQGYLADIRGTLWVELDHEVEVAQINSAIRMLNEMKENADDVVSDWGVATATQILFDISGFAVKDMQL